MKVKPRPSESAMRIVRDAVAAAAAGERAPRILFVCLGNICRSPAAQGITESMASDRGLAVVCDSAGFYGGHAGDLPDPRMREAAWQRGYRLTHRARKIHSFDLDDFDIVIGMDDQNMDNLDYLAGNDSRAAKLVRMTDFAANHPGYDSVPDPYYEGAAGFQLVLNLLEDACKTLLDLIESESSQIRL